jgi:predicted HicB family RNase H-like nuclease
MTDHLKYKDYPATINYSAEDEVFYGKIGGINDLVTFEGTSVSRLKKLSGRLLMNISKHAKNSARRPKNLTRGFLIYGFRPTYIKGPL